MFDLMSGNWRERIFSPCARKVAQVCAMDSAGAEGVVIPREANWTSYPLAQRSVDAAQLMKLLVQKGIIAPQEVEQLTRPQAFTSSSTGRGAVRGTAASVRTTP